MWRTIERLSVRLTDILPDIDLENAHGNYIKIENGWDEAAYANPELIFPYGVIGYSLDGLYCVFSLDPSKIDEELLVKVIQPLDDIEGLVMEIYGADDFLKTFYHSRDEIDFDAILKSLAESEEDVIQLEISIEFAAEEQLKEQLIETIISLFNLFKEHSCLVKLPKYE